MKNILFLLAILMSLTAKSQVSNDTWQNAYDLGWLDQTRQLASPTGTNVDTFVYGTNINSLDDYPYYYLSGCNGYTNTTANPANDVWYRFKASNYFFITLFSSGASALDTLHLNFYIKDNISDMRKVDCYTIDLTNNAYLFDTVFLGGVTTDDSIYMQVSGNSLGATGNYYFELTGAFWQLFAGVYYTETAEVICFDYAKTSTNETSPGANNGTATITISAGNSPYSFSWSDGSTDSTRANLVPGKYYVTITDAGGCQETDSVIISTSTDVSYNNFIKSFTVFPNPSNSETIIEYQLLSPYDSWIYITDITGRELKKIPLNTSNGRLVIETSSMPKGIYTLSINIEGNIVKTEKLIVN